MKFIINGVEYVSGMDAAIAFCTNVNKLGEFRKQGMPFEIFDSNTKKKLKAKHEKYFYAVKKCQKWFAGENIT